MSHSFTHHRHRLNTGAMPQENCLPQIAHKTGPGRARAATVVARATGETDRFKDGKNPSLHAPPCCVLDTVPQVAWHPAILVAWNTGEIAWHGETHRSPSHRCGRLCEWLVQRKNLPVPLLDISGRNKLGRPRSGDLVRSPPARCLTPRPE